MEFTIYSFTVSMPNLPFVESKKNELRVNYSLSSFFLLNFYGSKSSQLIGVSSEGIFSRVAVSH